MQYRNDFYAEGVFDTYWFEKNLQGDIVAVYDAAGTKLVTYTYDAWGNCTTAYHNSGASTTATYNPFRYRGYCLDTETGFYYLNSRYYDPVIGRFINPDNVALLGANGDFASYNLYAYCGNNPISRVDSNGHFWNTLIGAVAGAVVGGVTAAITGQSVSAGIVSGAISGAVSGAAVDIAIATGGVGLVAFAGVVIASGAGGAASSYVNQRMNGKEVDIDTVICDGLWGAVGGALSFGMAGIGGKTCKTLAENLALRGSALVNQVKEDFATAVAISAGTWLNGSKMNYWN